jgi:TPR repeat protein
MRPRISQLTATAALVVGLSMTAVPALAQQAGDFEKGVAAFEIGQYKEAIEFWEPLAEQGNVDALRNLAQLYRLGLGVQQDDAKAFALYEDAAERGSDEAQVNVAFLLLTGKGVDQDREKAASWFAKASDQGNALAQYNLGLMYEKGIGVEQDEEFSLELYRVAAGQGQKRAIARLAALEGSSDEDQTANAEKAAAEAAAKAEAEAKAKAEAEAKAAEMAANEADEAPALSIKPVDTDTASSADADSDVPIATGNPTYKPDAEENGVKDDRPVIDVVRTPMRKPGEKVADAPKGDEPTPIYITKVTADKPDATDNAAAADTGPTPAYVIRETASDQAKDTKTAASLSTNEMRAPSDPVARVKLAEKVYRGGDFAGAANLLEPLANAGMPIAQFWLGRMYNRGEGVDLNRAEAYSLWRSAASAGSERAATALANLTSRLSPDEIIVAEQRHAESGRAR